MKVFLKRFDSHLIQCVQIGCLVLSKIDGHNRNYLKKHHLQKQNHATIWQKNCAVREACLS